MVPVDSGAGRSVAARHLWADPAKHPVRRTVSPVGRRQQPVCDAQPARSQELKE